VELERVMNRVLDDQKLALRAKELKLNVNVQELTLCADFEKLRVILDNLMSNAIKFSPAGATVSVTARELDGEVQIEVADEGPGIRPEERSLVFEPFYRGQYAADALVKGTGIGLSVVREYAQMLGGRTEIVDAHGGACIRVYVPLNPDVTPEPVLVTPQRAEAVR
jgi:two-component system sensor histidine kinase GlrK